MTELIAEDAVVQTVSVRVGAAVNAAVRHVEHETTLDMRATTSELPLGATMIVPTSEIAEVAGLGAAASNAGSPAGSSNLCTGGNIASTTNSQFRSNKRKARDHRDGRRISRKLRTSRGGDDVHPEAVPVQGLYSSRLAADQQSLLTGSCPSLQS